MVSAKELISTQGLEKHSHGGYFKPTFVSSRPETVETASGPRPLVSTIIFMLSKDSPVGYFNCNQSDVLHFYHSGATAKYHIFDPETKKCSVVLLGTDAAKGHVLSFVSKAGWYKAVELVDSVEEDFVMLSEAVVPAFHPDDFKFVEREDLVREFPERRDLIQKFTMEQTSEDISTG